MPLSNKMRQDGAPILFFGLFVATKTYYLIVYLTSSEDLWGLLGNIDRLDDFGPGAAFFLTGGLSYILYYVTALAFDILVFFSFIGRVAARERPEGFWENVYPLITVFLPVTGFTLLFIPGVRQLIPSFSATPVGFYLFTVAVVLQVARAKIEERKFLRTVPEYAAYRETTGFLWPLLRKTG